MEKGYFLKYMEKTYPEQSYPQDEVIIREVEYVT
jgi:hypothetical protein